MKKWPLKAVLNVILHYDFCNNVKRVQKLRMDIFAWIIKGHLPGHRMCHIAGNGFNFLFHVRFRSNGSNPASRKLLTKLPRLTRSKLGDLLLSYWYKITLWSKFPWHQFPVQNFLHSSKSPFDMMLRVTFYGYLNGKLTKKLDHVFPYGPFDMALMDFYFIVGIYTCNERAIWGTTIWAIYE